MIDLKNKQKKYLTKKGWILNDELAQESREESEDKRQKEKTVKIKKTKELEKDDSLFFFCVLRAISCSRDFSNGSAGVLRRDWTI